MDSMSACVCRAVKLFGRGVLYTQSLTVMLTGDSEWKGCNIHAITDSDADWRQ